MQWVPREPSEAGQTMAEYATMLGILIVAGVAMVTVLAPAIEAALNTVTARI